LAKEGEGANVKPVIVPLFMRTSINKNNFRLQKVKEKRKGESEYSLALLEHR
jgi:hypothetical protein